MPRQKNKLFCFDLKKSSYKLSEVNNLRGENMTLVKLCKTLLIATHFIVNIIFCNKMIIKYFKLYRI